ncbi:hypothetical protein ACU61A_15685 [Pseudonocardia sichuanensis]
MASIHDDPIARLLLGAGTAGRGVAPFLGALLTAWDPVTYANTVTDGTTTYTNVVVLQPGSLVLGRVLLAFTPAGPVVLGNSYQLPPPIPVED